MTTKIIETIKSLTTEEYNTANDAIDFIEEAMLEIGYEIYK